MSEQSEDPEGRVERGHTEEATGAPLTPAEEEASKRPPSAGPGFVASEEPDAADQDDGDAADFQRLKELNPDDFE